jgi:ankyrin
MMVVSHLLGVLLVTSQAGCGFGATQLSIHNAALDGQLSAVRQLVADNSRLVSARSEDHYTPLHCAVLGGHLSVVRYLLENGADVNAKASRTDFRHGATPVHLASSPEILKELLYYDPDLSIRTNTSGGETPLQHATAEAALALTTQRSADHEEWRKIVTLLLDAGAHYDIFSAINLGDACRVRSILRGQPSKANKTCGFRMVPLRLAGRTGQDDICKILLEYRADPDDYAFGEDWFGEKGGIPILCDVMQHPRVVRMLLDAGAVCDKHVAVHGGVTGTWSANPTRATPLHYAAAEGVVESAQLLLTRGVNIDAFDAEGLTPLHIASRMGHQEMVKLFLRRGANPTLRDHRGRTALVLAERTDQANTLISLLREAMEEQRPDYRREDSLR